MQIKLADSAGFCFGVNRAVEIVYDLLKDGKQVCTLGPIIHNPQLVEELRQKGVKIIKEISEIPENHVLVIRSHGVPKSITDELTEKNITYIDATCPFVSKIHKIVIQCSREGSAVLIAGDATHPEVIGIRSYVTGQSYVFNNAEELEELTQNHKELSKKEVCVVAQTTFNAKEWEICDKIFKKVYTNAKIFGTICDATTLRQQEAIKLSKESDLMIIIGGRESSNTTKLRDVCMVNTKTVLIETARELKKEDILGAKSIGVTAGASTPAVIIKEVFYTMEDILNNELTVEAVETNEAAGTQAAAESAVEEKIVKSFEEMTDEEAFAASLDSLNNEQKVKGYVLSVGPTEIQVDIGRKYAGYVPADELSNDPSLSPFDIVKVGDTIDLIVMKTNDQEGVVTLSKKRFDAMRGWEDILKAKDTEEVLTGNVIDVIKGGVLVNSNGVRVFVPASLSGVSRGEPLEQLLGQSVNFRIIEINRGRRAVGSIRATQKEQRSAAREALWASIEKGKVYEGRVKSLTTYGAFVDIGGVDGMVHISELSWQRIKHPSEVVNEGDVVEVFVKDFDPEKKKISLGYKKDEDNPWEKMKSAHFVGDVVEVTVVSMTAYGAFANIIPGIDGLIHISQISDKRIEKPQDALKVGEKVQAKITEIDFNKKRISLSIKALIEKDVTIDEQETASDTADAAVNEEVKVSDVDIAETAEVPESDIRE